MVGRRFRTPLLVIFALLQVCSLIFVAAPAYASNTELKPLRGIDEEYYYYDGADIYGAAGQYPEPVKFVKKYGDTVYVPDGATMNVLDIKKDAPECGADSVPVKLWNRDEAAQKEPAFFLNIVLDGSVELDLKDDQEDGVFRWDKIDSQTIEKIREHDEEFPESISGGTLANDHRTVIDNDSTEIELQNDDLNCRYFFFKNFHRLISPYDDDTLQPGPLAGTIMGRQGVPFEEYITHADNRLAYRAYNQSARDNTIEHCNRQADIYGCIADVDAQFQKCYAEAIRAGGANLQEDAKNVMSNTWKEEFESEKFVDCFGNASELYSAPKNYFTDKTQLTDFAQQIVDETDLPPSLNPAEPDPIKEEIDDETQCSLGMLGWILCPVFSFIASVNDQVFDILKNWLVLAPFQQGAGGSNAAAYDVWSKLRNIVNSLFIIFFLILIYSQVTGRGITTYGVRALLPRIIVGAILVNMSYILCSVAVDITNSLGDSIYRLLSGMSIGGATVDSGLNDGGWENITASLILGGGAIAGTIALIANLSALVPIMVMAFVALVTTFLVLLLRQALIIVLVAASPFAFLLFVLPNTQSWFGKWRKMFISLLMLYPAFALIFAGSQIAAEIVRDTAGVNGDTLLSIFALGITVIPLFLLPLLMKLGGGVLNRFGGIVNNTSKGPFDRMRKGADEFRKDRKTQQQTRALNGRAGALGYGALIRANQRNKAKHQYHATNARRAASSYTGRNQEDVLRSALGSNAAKDLQDQLKDVLRDTIDKELREEYEAASVAIENSDREISNDELKNMANNLQGESKKQLPVDPGEQAAAMGKVMESGNVADIDEMLDQLHASQGQITELQREVLMKTAGSVSGGAAHLNAANIEQTLAGGVPAGMSLSDALYKNAASRGAYSPDAMASQDADSIAVRDSEGNLKTGLAAAAARGAVTAQQYESAKQSFNAARADTKLDNRMTARTRNAGSNM